MVGFGPKTEKIWGIPEIDGRNRARTDERMDGRTRVGEEEEEARDCTANRPGGWGGMGVESISVVHT